MRVILGSLFVLLVATSVVLADHATMAAGQDKCGGLSTSTCGVTAGSGDFHGLIAVTGAPWVLADASRSGTAGCGDCVWTLLEACGTTTPTNPDACTTNELAGCEPGQNVFRVFLTTDAVVDAAQGSVCLGGPNHVVAITAVVDGDIERFFKNTAPPDCDITTRPSNKTLAGLTTYFSALPPAGLQPIPFGGPDITEAITMTPRSADWTWGDGSGSGWLASTSRATHRYLGGGVTTVTLATRWAASYTITYAGETFGPYDATGQLTKTQTLTLPVTTSSPTLVD